MKLFQDIKAGKINGEIGNKAKNLRLLYKHGFGILPTHVLSVETVKRLFSPRLTKTGKVLFTARHAGKFFSQLYWLFPSDAPFIIRSSSKEEDGRNATFAGMYESAMVFKRELVMAAIKKCIRSCRGKRSAAYRRLIGKNCPAGTDMALIFEPFVEADFGGVARFEHRERIVIEMSRKGNINITGGKSADFRFILDIKNRQFDCPDTGIVSRDTVMRIFSRIIELKQTLFPGHSASVEFLLKNGNLIFLQARPVMDKNREESIDMAGIYYKIKRMMDGFKVKQDEWSLMESADLAAFNYLQAARRIDERLEHFRVRISHKAKEKISGKGWLNVKYDNDDDIVFPSMFAVKGQKLINELAKNNIFVIFVLAKTGEDIIYKALDFKYKRKRFSLAFSYSPEGIEKDEETALAKYSREEAVEYLGRLDREREIWLRIKEKFGAEKPGAYERKLSGYLVKELELIERKKKIAGKAAAKNIHGAKEIRGIPFKPMDTVITGTAVTCRNVASTGENPFIYFGYDLEPCFIPYIDKIKAVVVSRGAFGSHAAQICCELGVPLILETGNLGLVKDGDRVSLNLKTGAVNRI